jgi:adenylate cyclase
MRLDPQYSFIYPFWLGHAYKSLQRHDDAVVHLRRALTRNPEFPSVHLVLAETYAHLGWLDEARREASEALRFNPGFSIRISVAKLPYADDSVRDRAVAGLRLAGLPG